MSNTDPQYFDVIIVGSGHAGAQAAIALRHHGFQGSIALVGEESHPPYERPPLSKEYLAGKKSFERILLRPVSFWLDREIQLLSNTRIDQVDSVAKVIVSSRGERFHYGQLIWAAGGRARALSSPGGQDVEPLFVRTRNDVDHLLAQLSAVSSALIIGGGYIGLETAAALNKLGKQVTVLEAANRLLARVGGETLSDFYAKAHRSHGVDIRLGCTIERAGRTDDGRVFTQLASGEVIAADILIVGIGIDASVEPLRQAGAAATAAGVRVDEHCRTSLADVFAIGDCAVHRNRFAQDREIRLESVQNANDMAVVAAKAIIGTPEPYRALPWFWSNQFDIRLQTVGISSGFDQEIVRGDPESGRFSIIYLHDGQVIALDCVNMVRDYVQGGALVLAGARPNPSQIADSSIALATLA
ncbi:NAD(P)/FAD-dependent oxidoreductase [Mesorhizobium kowhaii]|uniref:Pyridine nucleotide-disulfide oxidoreductase n=1 Tax=Mesorhizobium kowhaii TaxID=1300272 RepID=A0A2W7CQE3_9HYPH|nr:FAD-dependent oxidoreductase [Mesorhizobium kowhaii]PZV38803.1 pyridine nucleotide-disulfide oxidoreductase [Mesorhizobium kowhaii]